MTTRPAETRRQEKYGCVVHELVSLATPFAVRVRDRNAVSKRQTATAVLDITVVDVNDNAPRFDAYLFEEAIYENNAATELWFPVSDADKITDHRFRLKEENQFVSVGE